MLKTEEEILAGILNSICNRALALSQEIKGLEKQLADKKEEYGQQSGELCYLISLLEKSGSRHAVPLKLIVGMTDVEIGIEAGKYEAVLKYKKEIALRKRKEEQKNADCWKID